MLAGKRVLVADDMELYRNFLRSFLKVRGFEVTVANDGVQALELCRQGTYDLVFSDIEMPNMNGVELLMALKKLPAYARVPVVILSTLSDEDMKRKMARLGAFHYMVKPFDTQKMDELFAKLG